MEAATNTHMHTHERAHTHTKRVNYRNFILFLLIFVHPLYFFIVGLFLCLFIHLYTRYPKRCEKLMS
jgi:hypothetical protein